STTDGALAQFGVKETNLLGRGQDLRFNATLSTKRQQYDIGFTEPYFLDRELAAGFDLFKTQTYTNVGIPYQEDTNGVRFRLGYALSEKWQHTLNYTFKQTDINNIQTGASRFIIEQAGKTAESSVGHTIAYDNRDNKQFPTSGEFASLTQDVAGVGGDAHYLRNEGRAAYYYPVAPKWTFALKGTGGYIAGFGENVRIADRFFLGGNSFRGFEPYGVGPHDSSTGDSLGGNAYYTVTPELTFPLGLPDDLGFAGSVFADAGSLWKVEDTGSTVNAPTALRLSAGAGVAWASPFGPIRIDLAKAIKKDQYDKTQIFQFNFGTRF
ncbi:MAG: outer membrane protein assembly factor BamA, partial [Pseudomonadota bacterium]